MNREDAKEYLKQLQDLIPVVEHFANVGDVQRELHGLWYDDPSPLFTQEYNWRKKPEPIEVWILQNNSGCRLQVNYDSEQDALDAIKYHLKDETSTEIINHWNEYKPILMRQVEE